MIEERTVHVDGADVRGITVALPKTRLTILATKIGYLMCGALDVDLLDQRHGDRRVVAGRALGVKSYDDLLRQPLESVTQAARELGILPGMTGRQALQKMLRAQQAVRDASREDVPGEG